MYYLVVILFSVGWVLLSIIRNYVATKSPISHKYLNHGILANVCLLKRVLMLIIMFLKIYLSLFSLILNPYVVVMLLRSNFVRVRKNKLIQNFFNLSPRTSGDRPTLVRAKDVFSCFYSSILFPINLKFVNLRTKLNQGFTSVTYSNFFSEVVSRRNYSSIVLQSNISQLVQSIDADKDIHLKDFYEWLCGLTDGEGMFYILRKNEKGLFEFNYIIGLHIDDINMLRFIKEVLGTGKVITSGKVARFSITSLKGIEKILNIFTEYPLNTTKLLNFLAFKKAYELYTGSKSKEDVAQSINELKNGMNNKRTNFQMPIEYKPKITSYWLLGFVEGEGSFFVKKDQYKLTFTLTQSIKDFALMESIKDFLYNLPGIASAQDNDKTSIRVIISKDFTNNKPIARLTITQIDLIKYVIIPFFSNIIWRSKKELDFQDWVAIFKLKERGHHYQEEGKNILNLIISQMNNNRLSSNQDENLPIVGREQLYLEINKLLNGPSNIEVKEEGRLFIKSLNRFYTGSGKTEVQIISNKGLVFKTFTSLSDCAKFLGISQPTAKNRLIKNQPFLFENNPYYLKKIINNDSDILVSVKRPEVKTLNYEKELKDIISAIPRGVGKPVIIYEKFDSSGFKMIGSFVSARRAGKFLGISGSTVTRYVQSGQIYKERYKFSSK